jgi:hypothetical protein
MIYNPCIKYNASWGPATGHAWRTDQDIMRDGFRTAVASNMQCPASTGPGAYNDPDYLNGNLAPYANQSQLSLWAMMSSPLILGFRPSAATSAVLAIYNNSEVIAIDQDSLCYQARYAWDNYAGLQVFKKNLNDGNIAVAATNFSNENAISFSAVTATKVRMWLPMASSVYVKYFKVYNGTNTTDLALNKTATVSSGSSSAYALTDGNDETGWQCNGASPSWMVVDFGSSTQFTKIVWENHGCVAGNFIPQYWTGSTWQDISYTPVGVDITINWSDLGITGSHAVRDLWEHANKGSYSSSYTASVPQMGTVLLKITGGGGTTYNISASAGSGGSISPSGTVSVNSGSNQAFSISASSGYAISQVAVDGTNQGAVSGYTFSNVVAAHTISASFSTTGGGGSNLAIGKTASASSFYSAGYEASQANDANAGTRWNASGTDGVGAWLQIDFGTNTTINHTVLSEYGDRITGYRIEYYNGSWQTAYTGTTIGSTPHTDNFTAVTGTKARLYVTAADNCPTIWEFEIYNGSGKQRVAEEVTVNDKMSLQTNPEPFNPSVSINYVVPLEAKNGTISIYTAGGQLIKAAQVVGKGTLEWNATGNPSGLYLLTFKVGQKQITKKMMLMK